MVLIINLHGTDLHFIGRKLRDTHADTRNEAEVTRFHFVHRTQSHRIHFGVDALVQGRLVRGNVVFRPNVGQFRTQLECIGHTVGAIKRHAVVINAVLDLGNGTSQRTGTVLEGSTESEVTISNITTKRAVSHIGFKFAAFIKVVGLIVFTSHVNPKIHAGLEVLTKRSTVGNGAREYAVCATCHCLHAERRQSLETVLAVVCGNDIASLSTFSQHRINERIVSDNFHLGSISKNLRCFLRQFNRSFVSIDQTNVTAICQSQSPVNRSCATQCIFVNHEHAVCCNVNSIVTILGAGIVELLHRAQRTIYNDPTR